MTNEPETLLLDSNVFIEPKNRSYPFDVFPGYWQFLQEEMGVLIMPLEACLAGSPMAAWWRRSRWGSGFI